MTDDPQYPPVIKTFINGQELSVSEPARRQAALNILRDPALRARLIEDKGEEYMRRYYPELWWTEAEARAHGWLAGVPADEGAEP